MICKCGLRRDHYSCNQCGMHVGVNNLACISCHGFRFSPVPIVATGPQPAARARSHHRPHGSRAVATETPTRNTCTARS